MEEYIDVLDCFGNQTGLIKTRKKIHQDGDFHRVVHTWIYNEKGEILLQKRSLTKDNHPGCWDISSAGHVHALETSLNGVKRECKEELGININPKDAIYITTIKRTKNPFNQELADIYLLKLSDKIHFSFTDKEVEDAKYFSIPQIEAFLHNKNSHVVVREEYSLIFQRIRQEKNLHL